MLHPPSVLDVTKTGFVQVRDDAACVDVRVDVVLAAAEVGDFVLDVLAAEVVLLTVGVCVGEGETVGCAAKAVNVGTAVDDGPATGSCEPFDASATTVPVVPIATIPRAAKRATFAFRLIRIMGDYTAAPPGCSSQRFKPELCL